jgi:hypothetical protein
VLPGGAFDAGEVGGYCQPRPLGLSRSEYVRRRLAQDAATASPVSVEDLARLAGTFADLADPDVMSQAWT